MIPPVRNELHETEEDDNSEDDPEDQPAHDSRVARDSSGLVVVVSVSVGTSDDKAGRR